MTESKVTIGNRKSVISNKIGDLKVTFDSKKGTKTFTLQDVKHVPQLCINLLSIPIALAKGFNIGNEGKHLFLQKGDFVMLFNQLFKTVSSYICRIKLLPYTPDYAAPALDRQVNMKLQQAHSKLGHCGKDHTQAIAKYYG